jgi:hypothetical protein
MHRMCDVLPDHRQDWARKCLAAQQLRTVCRSFLLLLALTLSGPVLAAGFTCAKPGSGERNTRDEPQEAVSRNREATLSGKGMQAWLKSLVGQYTYDGYVDLCGKGNAKDQRPVTGKADCIATGVTPNVHCKVNVSWPAATREDGTPVLGGVPNLARAEYVFSMEIPPRGPLGAFRVGKAANGWGLVFVQLDSGGNAEWASGVLYGDTFVARELCVDIPGNCHKTTRITVMPHGDIFMQAHITLDRERVLRQVFTLHRQPDARQRERSAGSVP